MTSLGDHGVPAEYADETVRIGRRRLKAMRSRIEVAFFSGANSEEVLDWLVESGCSVALAEWMIDEHRRMDSGSSLPTRRRWILRDPVKVRTPLEVLASALLACAWIFLFSVLGLHLQAVSLAVALVVIGMALTGIRLLSDLLELKACLSEWRDRRALARRPR
jgi:hypothetical protein